MTNIIDWALEVFNPFVKLPEDSIVKARGAAARSSQRAERSVMKIVIKLALIKYLNPLKISLKIGFSPFMVFKNINA